MPKKCFFVLTVEPELFWSAHSSRSLHSLRLWNMSCCTSSKYASSSLAHTGFFPDPDSVVFLVCIPTLQWREVPSEIEVASGLLRVLAHPMELLKASEKDIRLVIPLADSAFHRLIIHSVCQFYGVRSRSKSPLRLRCEIGPHSLMRAYFSLLFCSTQPKRTGVSIRKSWC